MLSRSELGGQKRASSQLSGKLQYSSGTSLAADKVKVMIERVISHI